MRLNICLEDPFGQKNHTAVKVPRRNSMVITVIIRISVLSLRVQIATFLDSSAILLEALAMTKF